MSEGCLPAQGLAHTRVKGIARTAGERVEILLPPWLALQGACSSLDTGTGLVSWHGMDGWKQMTFTWVCRPSSALQLLQKASALPPPAAPLWSPPCFGSLCPASLQTSAIPFTRRLVCLPHSDGLGAGLWPWTAQGRCSAVCPVGPRRRGQLEGCWPRRPAGACLDCGGLSLQGPVLSVCALCSGSWALVSLPPVRLPAAARTRPL